MTDSQHSSHSLSEEQSSLYVLGLMSGSERRDFERQLRGDAELRRTVRGLESALEGEVFGEPAPAAPARVWGKILERTRNDGAQVLLFPQPLLRWVPRLTAMAACLVLGSVLHSWWSVAVGGRLARGVAARESPVLVGGTAAMVATGAANADGIGESPVQESSPASGSGASRTAALASVSSASSPASDRDEVLHSLEIQNAELQGKVRGLHAKIAELGQRLQQVTVIPSGVTRLHVFSLGQAGLATTALTGPIDGMSRAPGVAEGPATSLAQSLARLAGDRMALALNTAAVAGAPTQDGSDRTAAPGTSGTGVAPGIEAVGKVTLLPARPAASDMGNPSDVGIAPIAGTAAVSTVDITSNRTLAVPNTPAAAISPIVFSAPDFGVHAVAVPTAPTGGQYQLWNRATDGTVSSLGILAPTASPVSVVTLERGSVEGLFMSLEPVGGSLQPTGPQVGNGQNLQLPSAVKP